MSLRIAPVIAILFLSMPFSVAFGQTTSLLGDWTGESICAPGNPSCHDEKVIYHVSAPAGDTDRVTIAADKIVDGKPEPMGVIELKYDASKHSLTGETQTARYHLWWEFTVKGGRMEGTLSILPDKTIARRIKVQKNESPPKEAACV